MDKIIGGLTVLAALVGVADAPLRRLMFTLAGVGALALIGLGIYEVVPKRVMPYQFLSITCGAGRVARSDLEIYPYVILDNAISAGVGVGYLRPAATGSPYFATCLLRNEGGEPVFNVQVAFAYLSQPLKSGPWRQTIDMSRGKVEWVSIPHVGTKGVYLIFESEVLSQIAFIAPTYSCTLENPSIGRRQQCSLPPTDQMATSFVTQVAVPIFAMPLPPAGPLSH